MNHVVRCLNIHPKPNRQRGKNDDSESGLLLKQLKTLLSSRYPLAPSADVSPLMMSATRPSRSAMAR